jgi:anti-sigma B factor antagonist
VTHRTLLITHSFPALWMPTLMIEPRLVIPGPRLGEGGEPPALQVGATDVTEVLAVVEVRGDLDTLTAPGFDRWVQEHLPERPDVVVDLDGVAFLASAGIAALMQLQRAAARRGVRVHLIGRGNRAVRRPLEVLGVEALLDLRADARAVVAELATTG